MALKKTTTGKASKFKKILVYGKSGVGKTTLCGTVNNPLIISSENKNESLADSDLPVWIVETIEDFEDAIKQVLKKKYKNYYCCCIDSISDIAETAILHEKPEHNDPRKAYIVVQDRIIELLKKIRDSDKIHFYIIAKAKMNQNDEAVDTYGPKMPGRQMGPELPYLFDFVFPMKVYDDEGENQYRYLQTTIEQDIKWDAKGNSKLKPQEEPNLQKLIDKLSAKKKKKK